MSFRWKFVENIWKDNMGQTVMLQIQFFNVQTPKNICASVEISVRFLKGQYG